MTHILVPTFVTILVGRLRDKYTALAFVIILLRGCVINMRYDMRYPHIWYDVIILKFIPKFDSTLHQELNEALRCLLKASYNPLPQGSGAISGGFWATNHQCWYIMREWEGEQHDLRPFGILSAPYHVLRPMSCGLCPMSHALCPKSNNSWRSL